MTEMTGAEMVIAALADQGVEHIFGYPGGAVLPIYDALVPARQSAAHSGAARAGRGPCRGGLCALDRQGRDVLVTSGPGATNAVTGLTDALMDSIPLVVITGQVPTHLIGNDAFQECDTVGITRPCTKHNYLVKSSTICRASCTRRSMSPRAAGRARWWSTFPKDVQFAKGNYFRPKEFQHKGYRPQTQGRSGQDQRGRRHDGRRQAAAVLHRRRRHQFRAARPATCCANWSSSPAFPSPRR